MSKELQFIKKLKGYLKAERCTLTGSRLWNESETASIPVSNSGMKVKVLKKALSSGMPISEIATRVNLAARYRTEEPIFSIEYLEDHMQQYFDEIKVSIIIGNHLSPLYTTEE